MHIRIAGGELVLTTLGALPEYFEPPDQLTSELYLLKVQWRLILCGTEITGNDYEPSPDKPTFTYFVYQVGHFFSPQ